VSKRIQLAHVMFIDSVRIGSDFETWYEAQPRSATSAWYDIAYNTGTDMVEITGVAKAPGETVEAPRSFVAYWKRATEAPKAE